MKYMANTTTRPKKMHKPLKGSFSDIINAIADGQGFPSPQTREMANERKSLPMPKAPPPKKVK